jgi:hypothetical protein
MQHSKELSDGEQDHLKITADPDSATTRQSFLLHLFQTLNLSDRDGVACIAKSTKIAIALRLRVLNDEIHPLLKLPAELIVAIGYQVMRINQTIPLPVEPGFPPPPRSDWRTAIGGFMNTSRRLRQELDLVPPGGVKNPLPASETIRLCQEVQGNPPQPRIYLPHPTTPATGNLHVPFAQYEGFYGGSLCCICGMHSVREHANPACGIRSGQVRPTKTIGNNPSFRS